MFGVLIAIDRHVRLTAIYISFDEYYLLLNIYRYTYIFNLNVSRVLLDNYKSKIAYTRTIDHLEKYFFPLRLVKVSFHSIIKIATNYQFLIT